MLRIFLLSLLSLFSGMSLSAQICAPWGDNTDITFVAAPVPATLRCVPYPLGNAKTSSWPTLRTNSSGAVIWYHCSDGFNWRTEMNAGTLAEVSVAAPLIVAAAATANPKAALEALIEARTTLDIDDPILLPVWCPSWAEMRASRPPPVAYIVSPYTGATYRATYPLSAPFGGTRSTTANGKVLIVTAGAPTACNCQLGRVVETSTSGVKTTYCSVQSKATTVANCSSR